MPVSGREIASLDFANLIGGPLNAIVEAQAKSAITTANFIKEVGFSKDGKVVNVDFTYNRKNDNGSDQEFTLTLPFITMLPIPYITVTSAEIEFNAKITSTTESKTDSNFSQQVDASAGGNYWFVSAKVTSKTAYQKSSSSSDREERTFDMRVRVEARNQDMPAGTERILTLLENAIEEKTSHKLLSVGLTVTGVDGPKITAEGADFASLRNGMKFTFDGADYTISSVAQPQAARAASPGTGASPGRFTVTPALSGADQAAIAGTTVLGALVDSANSAGSVVTLNSTVTTIPGTLASGQSFTVGGNTYAVGTVTPPVAAGTGIAAAAAQPGSLTLDKAAPKNMEGKTINIPKS